MNSVAVIVPIFKNANYLKRCLDSIANQTLTSIEVILATDGPDECDLICEYFVARDRRFKILKNPGSYGKAVNLAIKSSNSEYIAIVESDDWIDKSMFCELYNFAKNNDADVCKCAFICAFDSEEKNFAVYRNFRTGVLEFSDKAKVLYSQPSIWSAIYKKQFLENNNIFMIEQKLFFVDVDFHYKTTIFSSNFYFLNKELYFYYQDNPNQSIKNNCKPADGLISEYLFFKDNNPSLFCTIVYNGLLNALILHIKWNYERLLSYDDKQICINYGKSLLYTYFSGAECSNVINAAKPFFLLLKSNSNIIYFEFVSSMDRLLFLVVKILNNLKTRLFL